MVPPGLHSVRPEKNATLLNFTHIMSTKRGIDTESRHSPTTALFSNDATKFVQGIKLLDAIFRLSRFFLEKNEKKKTSDEKSPYYGPDRNEL